MENRGFSCFRVSSARVCRVWGIIKGGIENRIKRFWVERREVVRIFWIRRVDMATGAEDIVKTGEDDA